MKQYKLIARSQIINPRTNMIFDDDGLKQLDGYWESPVHEYDDGIHPSAVLEELIDEYEKLPEAMANCKYELKTL